MAGPDPIGDGGQPPKLGLSEAAGPEIGTADGGVAGAEGMGKADGIEDAAGAGGTAGTAGLAGAGGGVNRLPGAGGAGRIAIGGAATGPGGGTPGTPGTPEIAAGCDSPAGFSRNRPIRCWPQDWQRNGSVGRRTSAPQLRQTKVFIVLRRSMDRRKTKAVRFYLDHPLACQCGSISFAPARLGKPPNEAARRPSFAGPPRPPHLQQPESGGVSSNCRCAVPGWDAAQQPDSRPTRRQPLERAFPDGLECQRRRSGFSLCVPARDD